MSTSVRFTGGDRCIPHRVGWSSRDYAGLRELEFKSFQRKLQLQRTSRNPIVSQGVFQVHPQQVYQSSYGQFVRPGLHKQPGGAIQETFSNRQSNLGRCHRQLDVNSLQSYIRGQQHPGRLTFQNDGSSQLDVAPSPLRVHRRPMGSAHSGQVRQCNQRTVTTVQQPLLGTIQHGHRCPVPDRLGPRKQFCQSPLLPPQSSVKSYCGSESPSDNYRPQMAKPTVVLTPTEDTSGSSSAHTHQSRSSSFSGNPPRTQKESRLEDIRLESLWRQNLECLGWSERATAQLPLCLARSTLHSYNVILQQLYQFCSENNYDYPPTISSCVANFFCHLADRSTRPQSIISTASAAMGHLFASYGMDNLTRDTHVVLLKTALIKSSTRTSMSYSQVMPMCDFIDLFDSWPDNNDLCTKQLRQKTVCLLSLSLMLRPSDIAPKSVWFDPETCSENKHVFSVKQIQFLPDESAKITFFGIKNDTQRTGFEVVLPKHDVPKLDPIRCLKDYIERTASVRPAGEPVFLALRRPHNAIDASTVSRVLEECIQLAGLSGRGYSAKSFRPTGATSAIDKGIDPQIVQKLGRWKTSDVFYKHYVHSRTPDDYLQSMFHN